MAHKMAIESPQVTADVIEVGEFPQVVQLYQVYSVPKVVINESITFEGALPEPQFLGRVVEAAAQKTAG